MRKKKRVIGLLLICLLTAGIASAYAQGGNPLDEVWSTITTIMSRIAALEARVDVLEGIGPTYTVRIDNEVTDPYGSFDVWNYVKNPSLTIERGEEGPLHNVEVQYLAMSWIEPDGETYWCTFYPNGWFEDASGSVYLEWMEARWDSTVHPGETSLVYYGGWGWLNADPPGADLGIWQYTYELCVEYEGTTYNLVNTFEINVVQESNVGYLYLYEKDPSDWSIVEGGAWGMLRYNLAGTEFEFVFNGHGLEPGIEYELIYYCDPWPGTGGFVIERAMSDASGDVHIEGSEDLGTDLPIASDENYPGARIWLVRCDQYDEENGQMTHWIPEEILFEDELITFDDTDD